MGVRFGGVPTPGGFAFELSGGDLALDLTNTLDRRPTANPHENLRSWADLVAWSEQAGAIDAGTARRLRAEGSASGLEAQAVLTRVQRLREAIFSIFSALASGRAAPRAAVDDLNAEMGAGLARLRLRPREGAFSWVFEGPEALDAMVGPVVRAAGELLASGRHARVRICSAPGCDWLFLDTSRNRTRRWCDMTVCGNREKARRHHARSRRARPPARAEAGRGDPPR